MDQNFCRQYATLQKNAGPMRADRNVGRHADAGQYLHADVHVGRGDYVCRSGRVYVDGGVARASEERGLKSSRAAEHSRSTGLWRKAPGITKRPPRLQIHPAGSWNGARCARTEGDAGRYFQSSRHSHHPALGRQCEIVY